MLHNSPALFQDNTGDFNENSPLIAYRSAVSLIVTTTANALFPASNLLNPATHLLWKGTAVAGTEYITITPLAGTPVDSVCVARHNFQAIGASVSLEAAVTVDGGGNPVYFELVPPQLTDASAVMFRFNSAEYIRLRIKLTLTGTVVPQAAVVYASSLLVLQRRIYVGHTPLAYGRMAKVSTGRSESGNFLGRVVVGEGRSTSFSIQNMTPFWYRAVFDPFVAASLENPFFFAWRPGAYPKETGFAWLTTDPRPTNQRTNGMMQVSLELSGIV